MSWQSYIKMSKRQRRALLRKANRGDEEAIADLRSYTNQIRTEVNRRLYQLERAGRDYGKAYNYIAGFTQTEYSDFRFKGASKLKDDYDLMYEQNEVGLKFLNTKESTPSGMRKAEKHRLQRLKELEALPKGFSARKEEEFLRFLGSEEVAEAIDEYGTSDVLVEAMYDAYTDKRSGGTTTLQLIQENLLRFLGTRGLDDASPKKVTFDQALEKAGINIEKYRNRR